MKKLNGGMFCVDNVRVFKSVARSEDGQKSEIDLLVEIKKGRSLFDLIHFKHKVKDRLCVNVDVVT